MRLEGDAALEWSEHWQVVLAATAGVAMSTINVYSAGLFIEPFEQELGWTRGQITSGAVIAAVVTVVFAPFMGAAIDRLGPRRIGIVGIVVLSVLTAALSLVGPDIKTWWAAWTLLAMINLFIQPSVWTSAVSGFFSAGRGFALAATLCGSGIGSLVIPRLTFELIEHFGWRTAFVGLAVFWGSIVIPIVTLCFTSQQDRARMCAKTSDARPLPPRVVSLGELTSRQFLRLALAGLLIAAVAVSIAVSLVPILSWRGFSRGDAASIAGLLGFSSIAGRLTIGYFLDRIEGRLLAGCSVCLPIVTSVLLIFFAKSGIAASAAVLALGLALGAELDIVAYLTSRYFRLENFGLLFGTLAGLVTLAGGVGPWVISIIYDRSRSYMPALWAVIPMCIVSSWLFLSLGPYPTPIQAARGPIRRQ